MAGPPNCFPAAAESNQQQQKIIFFSLALERERPVVSLLWLEGLDWEQLWDKDVLSFFPQAPINAPG